MITTARDVDGVCNLLRQYGPQLNVIHLSAALTALQKLGQRLHPAAVEPSLNLIYRHLTPKISDCQPRQLSNIMWAASKLQGRHAGLIPHLPKLMKAFLSHMSGGGLDPQNISNTLWATANMEQTIPQRDLQLLVDAVVGVLGDANPQDVSNLLWAVGKMGRRVPKQQLEQLVETLVGVLPQARPQHVSMVIWALGTMDERIAEEQLGKLLNAMINVMPLDRPQHVSNTLWGVARMGHRLSQRQCERLVDGLVAVLMQAKSQEVRWGGGWGWGPC